jgi:aryl-alcohol dehydrogenase-like predicted oxidoreductase
VRKPNSGWVAYRSETSKNERMNFKRRALLIGGVALATTGAVGLASRRLRDTSYDMRSGLPARTPETVGSSGTMPYRRFGATGLQVSEVGFGAWAIGGKSYGAVDRQDSLRALARAEELGCNLVDTAMVYGDSEVVLVEFLRGRRSRWIVATKYSYQPAGMTATLERQLTRLGTDVVDFYQLHSMPPDRRLYDELYELKRAGKVRFVGVSLYSAQDIDQVIDRSMLDGVQLRFSLLDPDPFLRRVARLRQSGLAVLVRSTLKEGFLTGKFKRDATFPDANDQRHTWSAAQIARTVDDVERFRFLEADAGSMVRAAVAYPLSFPEVSTVLLGTKNTAQAESNFGEIPGARLSAESLRRVLALQDELDSGGRRSLKSLVSRVLGRY